MAYILKKICLGYKTDKRSLDKYGDNLMIEECLQSIVTSKEEIEEALRKFIKNPRPQWNGDSAD